MQRKCSIDSQELMMFFKEYGDVVEDVPITNAELERIIKLVELENYRQIFYDFSFEHILVLLNFFEQREEYITCKVILEAIESINRTTGENHQTHL